MTQGNGKAEFARGWAASRADVAAAIGCNEFLTMYKGELWAEKLRDLIAAEREECAKVADRVADSKDSRDAELIARDIRARGSKQG